MSMGAIAHFRTNPYGHPNGFSYHDNGLQNLLIPASLRDFRPAPIIRYNQDTSTAQGRMVFGIFASLAEFERELIRERTQAGLKSARARGRKGGRPKGMTQAAIEKAAIAEALYKNGSIPVKKLLNN